MQSLPERRIRNSLIDQREKELYNQIQSLEYQEVMIDSVNNVLAEAKDKLIENEIDMEEVASEIKDYFNNMSDRDLLNLKQFCRYKAEIDFLSKERFSTISRLANKELEKEEMDPETLENLKQSYETIGNFIDTLNQEVSELAKIAEEKGYEYALSKEARAEARKKVYKTPKNFINFYRNLTDNRKKYLKELQKIQSTGDISEEIKTDALILDVLFESIADLEDKLILEESKEINN